MDKTTIIAAIIAVFLVSASIYLMGFKNWLIWAVSEAEIALGKGTGKVKLHYVYNLAVARFPLLAKLIPFSMFSAMVDNALDTVREMIEQSDDIKNCIKCREEQK